MIEKLQQLADSLPTRSDDDAAMACYDLEEARDLLRHKKLTVTAIVYRAHRGTEFAVASSR